MKINGTRDKQLVVKKKVKSPYYQKHTLYPSAAAAPAHSGSYALLSRIGGKNRARLVYNATEHFVVMRRICEDIYTHTGEPYTLHSRRRRSARARGSEY